MTAYYNEIDPYAAQWLRNLIKAGHIAPGDVDERSIEDVRPSELAGYTQCHLFAGIGIWSLALRSAGWPDDRPVWTGSCPCQPFSAAGKRAGTADDRHLWPAWHYLIGQFKPANIFGEQVASKDSLPWLDTVQSDLEGAGYAVGPVDMGAAGVGSPNIRQRLWFVAERLADSDGRHTGTKRQQCGGEQRQFAEDCSARRLGNSCSEGLAQRVSNGRIQPKTMEPCEGETVERFSDTSRLAASEVIRRSEQRPDVEGRRKRSEAEKLGERSGGGRIQSGQPTAGPTNGFWRDVDWLFCRDGKWRPVEPESFPLAHGHPNRVGKLRAYGNAINAEVAKSFIESYLEA